PPRQHLVPAAIGVQGCLERKTLLRASLRVAANEIEIPGLSAAEKPFDLVEMLHRMSIELRQHLRILRCGERGDLVDDGAGQCFCRLALAATQSTCGARDDTPLGEQVDRRCDLRAARLNACGL